MERSGQVVDRVLGRVAAVGLPGSGHDPVKVGKAQWPHVIGRLTRERITGLASAAAEEGWLQLSQEQQTELDERQRSAMALVLVLEHLLRELSSVMANAGMETIVLKGAALAEVFYPAPRWRAYGDLDLLVPAAQWTATCDLLSDMAFERLQPEPRRGFDQRFGKGASFENAQGLQVDLHRTLALGPFGLWLDPEGLLEGTTTFSVNGMSLRRLDDTNSLIHASIHAALGGQVPRLMPLRDVLQIAWSGRVDWDLMEERTRGWRLTAPVSHALRTASRRLHVDLPTETERSLKSPVGWMERRVLEGYTTDRRTRGGMSVTALWAIPSLSGKVAYVRALLFPDRRFLEARAGAGSSSIGSRVMIPIGWALERMRRRLGRSGAARRRSTRTGSDLSSEKRDA